MAIDKKYIQPDIRLEVLRQLGIVLDRSDLLTARRLVEKADEAMADHHDELAGQFRNLESLFHYRSGDYQKSLAASRIAASVLAPYGESSDLGQAYLLSGKALVAMGN
ncbi:unnamed protein product, partial [marine sediment metagenome]